MASRSALALPLLLQSPPGQVDNVYDDLIGLVASDGAAPSEDVEEFKKQAKAARSEHNVEQLVVVDLPLENVNDTRESTNFISHKGNHKGILANCGIHVQETDRFLAPRYKVSFRVNHDTLETSDIKPYKPNAIAEPLRAEIEKFLSIYIQDKYPTGTFEVYAVPLPREKIEVQDEVMQDAKNAALEIDASQSVGSIGTEILTNDEKEGDKKNDDDGKDMDNDTVDDPVSVSADIDTIHEVGSNTRDSQGNEKDANLTPQNDDQVKDGGESQANTGKEEEIDEEATGDTQLVIHIVANKYKLNNFWAGRWRSSYRIESPSSVTFEGHCNTQVHYFEEGNVQLHTAKEMQLNIEGTDDTTRAKSIVRAIQEHEDKYQQELFQSSTTLSEGNFRALRRQLPMTRQKIDWDKVLNYRLGSELSKQT